MKACNGKRVIEPRITVQSVVAAGARAAAHTLAESTKSVVARGTTRQSSTPAARPSARPRFLLADQTREPQRSRTKKKTEMCKRSRARCSSQLIRPVGRPRRRPPAAAWVRKSRNPITILQSHLHPVPTHPFQIPHPLSSIR